MDRCQNAEFFSNERQQQLENHIVELDREHAELKDAYKEKQRKCMSPNTVDVVFTLFSCLSLLPFFHRYGLGKGLYCSIA